MKKTIGIVGLAVGFLVGAQSWAVCRTDIDSNINSLAQGLNSLGFYYTAEGVSKDPKGAPLGDVISCAAEDFISGDPVRKTESLVAVKRIEVFFSSADGLLPTQYLNGLQALEEALAK